MRVNRTARAAWCVSWCAIPLTENETLLALTVRQIKFSVGIMTQSHNQPNDRSVMPLEDDVCRPARSRAAGASYAAKGDQFPWSRSSLWPAKFWSTAATGTGTGSSTLRNAISFSVSRWKLVMGLGTLHNGTGADFDVRLGHHGAIRSRARQPRYLWLRHNDGGSGRYIPSWQRVLTASTSCRSWRTEAKTWGFARRQSHRARAKFGPPPVIP
ncbi:hypothetical protein B0T16DRAFT_12088 [Cercophora newfieldiana]|uniref:Uncharacterized protein n=1 Tax=Cercophora newfieldiana TaxID=92897 RepID=A0AA40CXR5_9PEZI|nr:hypothetical protein B0T16DRAFT_12088 [Cercophora newfieldiana]